MSRKPPVSQCLPLVLALVASLVASFGSLAEAAPAVPSAAVSSAWLAEQLAAAPGSIALVDARPGLKAYLTGHIPGAQPVGVENLRSAAGGVPGALYPLDTLHIVIRRLGLGGGTHAVVYSEESDIDATYVASVLRIAGLPKVSVLDGGFKRWSAEKRPVTAERKLVATSTEALTPDPRSLVAIDDVRKAVDSKGALLLDARPPDQYAAGHLPGAKNRFWMKDIVAAGQPEAGAFRGEAETRAELEALGATKDKPVIVYCNTGHQASELFFTLKYRLGYPDVRLYNGSWLEWSITPGTPKEVSVSASAPVPPR